MFKKWFSKPDPNNEEALRIIYDMFYERVYQTAYYITRDQHLAQDVLQETFIKAFRHIKKVTDGKKMGAWLSVIATNTAIDFIRKQNRRNEIAGEDVVLNRTDYQEMASSVEMELIKRCEAEQMRQHMTHLKPNYRQVLLLKYEQDLKYEEIASLLEETVPTVKSRIYRAKQNLKKIMQEEDVKIGEEGDIQ